MLNKYFDYLTKQQKSALCHSVKYFVKKKLGQDCHSETTESGSESYSLMSLFLENETYYIEMNASRLYFIKEFLEDEKFLKELKFYFDECLRYYEYQQKLEPLKQAQKEFAKEQRKKAREYKMSKEAPTKRQLSYYKSLCKKYELEQIPLENTSKLDLRNAIREIKNEHQTD